MKVAFAITRAASIDDTWTTVHLAVAALERGWPVRFIEPWDFEIDDSGALVARAHAFDQPIDAATLARRLSGRQTPRRFVDLRGVDLMLLRASPLDPTLLTFALLARSFGVRVVNDPTGLLQVSHKGWLASLPGIATPPSIVTHSRAAAQLFHDRQRRAPVIVKPARGSGGRGVSLVPPRRADLLDAAFDLAQRAGDGYVVVQVYLREAEDGEKRLVWLDGEVLGGYLRQRATGEFRHNLRRGGQAVPTVITQAERDAVETLSPALLDAGIRLAGLDVIGGHVIEVNALNPGGAFHTDRLSGTRLADTILTRLAEDEGRYARRDRWAHLAP